MDSKADYAHPSNGKGWPAGKCVSLILVMQVEQTHANLLQRLTATGIAPSALERLGTAQRVFAAAMDLGNAVADVGLSYIFGVEIVADLARCRCTLLPSWYSRYARLHGR